jgi:FMN phosphatase YigB (HAD superfamily)/DNA-binding XRE family transcriptional regulator
MAMTTGGTVPEQVLGKRLQAARQEADLTQQALCHKANLSYSTLAKIERGAIKAPSIFTIQAIAGALDLSLDALVGSAQSPALRKTRRSYKTKSGVSFIYFDVNGCLVRFYEQAFNHIADEFGITADVIETAFWHFNDDACRGTMSLDDFNKALAERLGIDGINWQDYYLAAAEPVKEMHELVAWAQQYYGVGLLTNAMPGLIGTMLRSGQLPNIPYDSVVDSSEVGSIKPEQLIYDVAATQSATPPEEILLIDDTRGNLNAADKLGWHVLWFDYAHPADSAARIREALEPVLDT